VYVHPQVLTVQYNTASVVSRDNLATFDAGCVSEGHAHWDIRNRDYVAPLWQTTGNYPGSSGCAGHITTRYRLYNNNIGLVLAIFFLSQRATDDQIVAGSDAWDNHAH
jgi:hypothetical protein